MKNNTSIVIVHWNTPELLKEQLNILYPDIDKSFEIIIVDNNSEKNPHWIEREFPKVSLIENKMNRGFAAACNQGFVKSKGEWILFLNPDAHITPKQIGELYEHAHIHQLAAVSPRPTTDGYKKPVPSTWSLLTEFTPLRYLSASSSFGVKSRNLTLTGGCLLINRTTFEKINGFDERFFLWFEDSDLTKRLLQNNYKYSFAPIEVDHAGGVSFQKLSNQQKTDMFFFAMNVYAHKHFSRIGKFIITLISKRYSKRKILPPVNNGVALTIPNMRLHLLHEFFFKNASYLSHVSELIVVSSAFSAEIVWELREQYPDARFISIDHNRGVASTINIGFRASSTEFVGTINDDVILNRDWIHKCLECIKNPGSHARNDPGSFNPLIYKPDGTLESAGVDVLSKGKAVPRHSDPALAGEESSEALPKCHKVDAVNAAVVLYTNKALNKTGIYDERFGSYLEDIDHSLRLSRNGFDNIVVPDAKVTHIGQATSKNLGAKKQFYDLRNWIFVIAKNWGVKKIITHFPEIFLERLRNLSGFLKALV